MEDQTASQDTGYVRKILRKLVGSDPKMTTKLFSSVKFGIISSSAFSQQTLTLKLRPWMMRNSLLLQSSMT